MFYDAPQIAVIEGGDAAVEPISADSVRGTVHTKDPATEPSAGCATTVADIHPIVPKRRG